MIISLRWTVINTAAKEKRARHLIKEVKQSQHPKFLIKEKVANIQALKSSLKKTSMKF